MSIDSHRATVMEEARARAAAREPAEPPAAPPTKRPSPMLNTGKRAPLVPTMAPARGLGIQPGHIAAGVIALVFLLALGLSISAPRQSEGPTMVWPTVNATTAPPQPSAPASRPTAAPEATALPTLPPNPTALPGSYIEPVNPAPAQAPRAPQPAYAPAPPAAPPIDPFAGPVSDLVPLPAEGTMVEVVNQPGHYEAVHVPAPGATPVPTPYYGNLNGGGGSWGRGQP